MCDEELEIQQFFREGVSIEELSEITGHTRYRLKKLLADEPRFARLGFIKRSLYEAIPPCPVKGT